MAFQRPREPETPFSSHAETEDGRIRVTVEDNGLVSTLSIAPRAMRNGSDELAELILATVREAQTAWFRKKLDKGPEASPDQEMIRKDLAEAEAAFERRLAELRQMMAELRDS
ncbi:hypothetical protein GCM10023191_053970 [Actinoallomurus oryzae]|jgi:hypothetical protein|uniref:YbaB/EbfC DNA-binding family protein n=1 Tax=Actinoallomurus oryzae TaxID=502180 RepID=A0ABP8QIH4_9ACTN